MVSCFLKHVARSSRIGFVRDERPVDLCNPKRNRIITRKDCYQQRCCCFVAQCFNVGISCPCFTFICLFPFFGQQADGLYSRWYITGNITHAQKSTQILSGWANTLQLLNGTDAQLTAGLYGPQFVNAAEIMRSSYPAWPQSEIETFKTMILNIFYPPASQTTPTALQRYPLYVILNQVN
jgi:hypothetical protein